MLDAMIAAAMPYTSELWARIIAEKVTELGRYEVQARNIKDIIKRLERSRTAVISDHVSCANDVARAYWRAVIREGRAA